MATLSNTLDLPQATRTATARRMLALLAAVFFLPFIVGTGLFWSGWRPDKFAHHGELLQPPLLLPQSGLHGADGRALANTELRGKWLLLKFDPAACEAACQQNLQQMRQVHLALNKEQSRLQRVFITSDEMPATEAPDGSSGLLLGRTDAGADGAQWREVFGKEGAALYVVDPLGNIILRYPAAGDLRGVLKDLERLLKYSWLR